jgi:hypothetical protein
VEEPRVPEDCPHGERNPQEGCFEVSASKKKKKRNRKESGCVETSTELKYLVIRAFNEVKATSRAHDKQVSLNTNRNYNVLQAGKPWASSEDMAALGRGRGAQRGRNPQGRGGGRSGNDWNPRGNFNTGGPENFSPQKPFNRGRGHSQPYNKFPRGAPQTNQPRNNNNNGGNSSNNSGGYPQKPRPNNKNFRGGGNN